MLHLTKKKQVYKHICSDFINQQYEIFKNYDVKKKNSVWAVIEKLL